MSCAELQEEEREVLLSIYEGDTAFKELTPTTFQYKYGEDNDARSFLVEISWNSTYPMTKPTIIMDTFYNRHIVKKLKDKVVELMNNEAEQWLGTAMTYTLFQLIQEHLKELIDEQPETISDLSSQTTKLTIGESNLQEESLKKPKKEQLTKAQKRRQWNRTDGKGEKPRGWDWIDIVKHLSQTGAKPEAES